MKARKTKNPIGSATTEPTGNGVMTGYEAEFWRMADTNYTWSNKADICPDATGFCKSPTLKEVCQHGRVLTLGHYVCTEVQKEDSEPFENKMKRLTVPLHKQ